MPQFRLNLQSHYELDAARLTSEKLIQRSIHPARKRVFRFRLSTDAKLGRTSCVQSISPRDLVLTTLDEFLAQLPANFRNEVIAHKKDPQQLQKGDTDICRLHILPASKTQVRFWSSRWCFYEIGVGHYAAHLGEGLNLGGISFVQFPFNESCGKGP